MEELSAKTSVLPEGVCGFNSIRQNPHWDLYVGEGQGEIHKNNICPSHGPMTVLDVLLGSHVRTVCCDETQRLRNLLKVTQGVLGWGPNSGTPDLHCLMPLTVPGRGNS